LADHDRFAGFALSSDPYGRSVDLHRSALRGSESEHEKLAV